MFPSSSIASRALHSFIRFVWLFFEWEVDGSFVLEFFKVFIVLRFETSWFVYIVVMWVNTCVCFGDSVQSRIVLSSDN